MTLRILVIDDNPDDRTLVIRELSRAFSDLKVEQISKAEDFKQALETGAFDLVVTDYQLRWSDGLTVLRAFKARYPDRPVVMFTNSGSEEVAVEAMKAGLDDYVIKSSKPNSRLSSAVRAAWERAKTQLMLVRVELQRQQAEAELRKANERLETQMAELQKANQLKDDFLSTVSHELRTPMANIKMAIKMLEATLARKDPFVPTKALPLAECSSVARYLQILNDECDREIALINDLLDLQRLEAGVEPLASEIIHFQTWLPQLVEPFVERAQNRQQTLQVDIPADLPPLVSDPATLGRILAELLNNACKYTPPGKEITITARAEKGGMDLQVSNSGVEIPAHELPRIFDKFYRVPSTDPWKQGGTGLGLALVQKLTQHLGGCISVRSEHGSTCFIVEFPLHAHKGED